MQTLRRFTMSDGHIGAVAALTVLLAACGGGGGGGGGAVGGSQSPTATLTAPANLATDLTGTLALTATASDDAGVTGVEFQVDGAQVGATQTGASPYSVGVDTTAYASGQHVVRVRARDADGNVSAWASATVQFGGSRAAPAGFTRDESWVSGLSKAAAFAQAPDGRLFVAEQGGALRVVKNGTLLATPFITLSVDSAGERGLVGVTLHPDFASNGYVYVYYTTTENVTHNRISRYTASSANPDVVSVGSELRIADLPALSNATNHNGGGMHFGLDGKLYVGVGENANADYAPLLTTVLGKMLRFNDDGSIPTDNPFYASTSGLNRAIWARGLRNPFTFAVQPGTGRIHINDVGANTWEEIDLGVAGADYGWPATEGPTSASGVTAPLFAYEHTAASPAGSGPGGFFVGQAIAGGAFYPSTGAFPAAYRDSYYFADFVAQFVARYDWGNDAAYAFASLSASPVDLLAGNDGALYVLTRSGIVRFSVP